MVIKSSTKAMLCRERARLVVNYRDTTHKYAEAVRKMTDLVGLGLESEVDVLRRSCRLAWDVAERARIALYRHEADHSCARPDFEAQPATAEKY